MLSDIHSWVTDKGGWVWLVCTILLAGLITLFNEAIKDAYKWLKSKIFSETPASAPPPNEQSLSVIEEPIAVVEEVPIEPEPVEIDSQYEVPDLHIWDTGWVRETKLNGKLDEGYSYWPWGDQRAKCFRRIVYKGLPAREFLMRKAKD